MNVMNQVLAVGLLTGSMAASAQCFGPGGCTPPAESALPNGYPVLGWSGPCLAAPCPEQATQAYWDLWVNARRAARAQRAVAD